MVLTVLNPEMWLYGVIGTIYTKSPYFAAFLSIFYWTGMTYIARHITDPFALQVIVHGHNLVSLLLGILVGLAFNWYLRQYTLADDRVIDKGNRNDTPWIFLLALGALTLGAAFYLLDGSYSDLRELAMSESSANLLGAALFVIGLAIVFVTVWFMMCGSELQRLNLKYILYAAVECATPALVDYFLFIEGYRPWQILNFVVGWILISIAGYYWITCVYSSIDHYWGREPACALYNIKKFIALKFAVVITTYTTAIILDEVFGHECTATDCAMVPVVEKTLAAVGIWSAVWIVGFLLARKLLCPKPITTLGILEKEQAELPTTTTHRGHRQKKKKMMRPDFIVTTAAVSPLEQRLSF